jgi:hypothetical protein
MKTLNSVIREMYNKKEEEAVDLDESTKAYAASLEKIANDKKLKAISKKDRETLAKLADLMKSANEGVELDENDNQFVELIKSAAAEEDALNEAIEKLVDLEEAKGYKEIYKKKIGKSTVNVYQYNSGEIKAMFQGQGYGETSFGIKKFDKGIIDKALKHFDDNQGLLGRSMDKIAESTDLEEARIDADDYTVGAEKTKKGYRGQVTHTAKGHTMYSAGKIFKDEKSAKAHAQAYLDGYARRGDRAASNAADDYVKRNSSKLAEEVIAEDYFTVQYYDAKGKAEEGKYKNFKDEKSAKKHLDRANKVVKDGEYKMFKVRGRMEEVELEEHISKRQQDTIKGATNPYNISNSLIDAVNRVVTGQTDVVETEVAAQNETIEQGAEICESVELDEGAENIIMKKGNFTRKVDAATAKKMKRQGWKIQEDNTNDKSDDGEGLDKVQPKALKKKFKDRKDKDIDNDGDVDDSDKFLHKKRKAISKAIAKDESADADDKEEKKPEEKKAEKKKDDAEVKAGKKEKIDVSPELEEAKEMTPAQEKKREEIVLKLKEKEAEFKKKYGDRWEEVMYATATKLAMK